jgi:hypothetical protein
MKKIAALFFLFTSLTSSAQNDAAEDTIAKPAITAIGKPDGKLTEMKIGKDGGSFSSSDGKIELKIPEGAIAKKTTFSIQPVTNLMPNGNGKAYRLEPSGIQFQKRLELIFHYDEDEAKDTMQLLMGIAMQDDKGKWYALKNSTLDTIAKTISGSINHFSVWASFEKLKLNAPKRVKVKKSEYLLIHGVSWSEESNNDELAELNNWKAPVKTVWRVNDIVKGDKKVGTLASGERDMAVYTRIDVNKYTAPDNIPNQNPVAVSVDLTGASIMLKMNKRNITFKKLKLVEEILIYDNAYEVTMVSSHSQLNASSVLGAVTYKDTGSFVVSITGKEAKIIEKVNKNVPDKLEYEGKCIVKQLKPGSGNIHILGVSSIKLIPATTPEGNATVAIFFKRAPTIFPLLNFDCPPVGGRGDRYSNTTAQANVFAASIMTAFPLQVKFEAKEGEQVIEEVNMPGTYYKVSVKKLKDD